MSFERQQIQFDYFFPDLETSVLQETATVTEEVEFSFGFEGDNTIIDISANSIIFRFVEISPNNPQIIESGDFNGPVFFDVSNQIPAIESVIINQAETSPNLDGSNLIFEENQIGINLERGSFTVGDQIRLDVEFAPTAEDNLPPDEINEGNTPSEREGIVDIDDEENLPPQAVDDTATTTPGESVDINVLANDSDPDPNDILSVVNNGLPENGSLEANADGTFTYTPETDFTGTDRFVYVISDSINDPVAATVNITVEPPANQPPEAGNDTATTTQGESVNINVLANDSDPDGDELTTAIGTQPESGTLAVNPNGTFTYTPNQGFTGTDSFTYTTSDGTNDPVTATINITVEPPDNTAPTITTPNTVEVAQGETDVIDINATDDTDAEGEGLTFAITGGANQNLFTINPNNGQLAFTQAPEFNPAGENNFQLQVTVTDSEELTAVQNLTVTGIAEEAETNTAPTITTPNTVEVAQGETDVIDINATDDTNAEGDGLTYSLAGTNLDLFTLNANTGELAFTEPPVFNPEGENSFSIQVIVTDADGETDVQDLTVNITNEEEPRNPVIPNLVTQPLNPVHELTGENITGTAENDRIIGTTDADILEGLGGNDVLEGGGGDDLLDGGDGNDTAVYQFDDGGVIINLATDTTTDGFGNNDDLNNIENIIGSESADNLTGDDQDNKLTGRGGNDTIGGGVGNDYLVGLAGVDVLRGNAGADNFVFVTPEEGGDIIEDFEVGTDKILIVGATFPGELSGGNVAESDSQFAIGQATTAEHRFIYNNGELLFDSDGAGGSEALTLATLTGNPGLIAEDIIII